MWAPWKPIKSDFKRSGDQLCQMLLLGQGDECRGVALGLLEVFGVFVESSSTGGGVGADWSGIEKDCRKETRDNLQRQLS